jgi:hypothetical protein
VQAQVNVHALHCRKAPRPYQANPREFNAANEAITMPLHPVD